MRRSRPAAPIPPGHPARAPGSTCLSPEDADGASGLQGPDRGSPAMGRHCAWSFGPARSRAAAVPGAEGKAAHHGMPAKTSRMAHRSRMRGRQHPADPPCQPAERTGEEQLIRRHRWRPGPASGCGIGRRRQPERAADGGLTRIQPPGPKPRGRSTAFAVPAGNTRRRDHTSGRQLPGSVRPPGEALGGGAERAGLIQPLRGRRLGPAIVPATRHSTIPPSHRAAPAAERPAQSPDQLLHLGCQRSVI